MLKGDLRLLSAILSCMDAVTLTRQLVDIAKELQATNAGGEEDQVGQAAATADEPWQGI